jgi:glutamate-1-semialdehyde aminotransferase
MAIDEQWTISIMHTKEDIQKTLEIADKVMSEIKGKVVEPLAVEEAI